MTSDWDEPDDWLDWPRSIADEWGIDFESPIVDINGNWFRPSKLESVRRLVVCAREIGIRNNQIKINEKWEPDELQTVNIWRAAVAHLPSKVLPIYTQGVRDDICAYTSSTLWSLILYYNKRKEYIHMTVLFRRAIASAKHEMAKGIKVPTELWGDLCHNSKALETHALFNSRPDWIAMKQDDSRYFNSIVDDLVHTWDAMLGLVGKVSLSHEETQVEVRRRADYRRVILGCIHLRKKWKEWQADHQKS